MRPSLIERHEHEYVRHGTRTLIANLEVATGQVITPSIGPTRTNKDFAAHIEKTIATDPDAGWVFVVDQLKASTNRKIWLSWSPRSAQSRWSWTGRALWGT